MHDVIAVRIMMMFVASVLLLAAMVMIRRGYVWRVAGRRVGGSGGVERELFPPNYGNICKVTQ
jgi:hypothetical protein